MRQGGLQTERQTGSQAGRQIDKRLTDGEKERQNLCASRNFNNLQKRILDSQADKETDKRPD